MKLLVIASSYPYPANPLSGIFNEKCVMALQENCEVIEVLAPRPLVPPLVSRLVPRWKSYASIESYELRNGVSVYRPASPVVSQLGGAFWLDTVAFVRCCPVARKMHRRTRFDAILSFDLIGAGGIAWRIGRDLDIPASGWATGEDVRVMASSSYGKAVARAIKKMDLTFYQSHELLEKAAALLDISRAQVLQDRHVVLPRGIPLPPLLSKSETRKTLRKDWGFSDDQVIILNIGRVFQKKGIFELLEAVSLASAHHPKIACVLVGSDPAFDQTVAVKEKIDKNPALRERVKLLSVCKSDKVWEYLCAADIFAFTSHNEGMPNSLLEAMAMEVPAIAFAIPPVLEIDAGTGALVTIPPFDSTLFADAILRLAGSPEDRVRIGERGKSRVMAGFMVKKNMAIALNHLARVIEKDKPSRPWRLQDENKGSREKRNAAHGYR